MSSAVSLLLLSSLVVGAGDGGGAPARLAALAARHDVPALGVVVLEGGRVVARGESGVRRRGHDARVARGDAWHLGSCTKAITATVAARLVERGVVHWETRLGDVFPAEVAVGDVGWRGATLEQLLRNRAGVPAESEVPGLRAMLRTTDLAPREARRRLLERVLGSPPATPPGAEYAYGNVGFAIAGHVLETVADAPFERLVEREIFAPLGMDVAGFGAPSGRAPDGSIRGHTAAGRVIEPGPRADNPAALGPAAGVHASLDGWARFVAVHLGHGPDGYLRADTLAHLHRGIPISALDGYGAGWLVTRRSWATGNDDTDRGLVLHHTGTNLFWYCAVWVAPERDLAVLVACNEGGLRARRAVDAAVLELVAHVEVEREKPPSR